MIRALFDWICSFFINREYGYKPSPIENSILKAVRPRKGQTVPEIQSQVNYLDRDKASEFEKILERMESVGLVRYKEGLWLKADRRAKKERRVGRALI